MDNSEAVFHIKESLLFISTVHNGIGEQMGQLKVPLYLDCELSQHIPRLFKWESNSLFPPEVQYRCLGLCIALGERWLAEHHSVSCWIWFL